MTLLPLNMSSFPSRRLESFERRCNALGRRHHRRLMFPLHFLPPEPKKKEKNICMQPARRLSRPLCLSVLVTREFPSLI